MTERSELPIIDVGNLVAGHQGFGTGDMDRVALQLDEACRQAGFFYVAGHGVDENLIERLQQVSHQFFQQPLDVKLQIRMELAGRAWRGYFPVGAELTSGKPDQKEGLYFGAELPQSDPRVNAKTPLHGPNQFPNLPGFRETVLEYLAAMTHLGRALTDGIALALGLDRGQFRRDLTQDPMILFRVFHYPPLSAEDLSQREFWSVGEHTDYGLLTILLQDTTGGLEVYSGSQWVAAPPLENTFVCNVGDMLERMTGSRYRSTPHRVRNVSGQQRYSFPFFFDPSFDAEVRPLLPEVPTVDARPRWDGSDLRELSGTYGDYLIQKVSRVFPELGG